MKRLVFVTIGMGALALSACNKDNADAVQNAEINQPATDLNEIANEAAMDAANSQAQANVVKNEAVKLTNAVSDNAINPKEADEQNVSGM